MEPSNVKFPFPLPQSWRAAGDTPDAKAAPVAPAQKKIIFKVGELVVYPAHGVGKISMDEVTKGVVPFMIAQFAIMFLMVAFPEIVMIPARWFATPSK